MNAGARETRRGVTETGNPDRHRETRWAAGGGGWTDGQQYREMWDRKVGGADREPEGLGKRAVG